MNDLNRKTCFFSKDAVAEFKIEAGQTAYNAVLTGARYLAPPLTSDVSTKEKESPQHHIETVTSEELLSAKKSWAKGIAQLPKLKEQNKVM